MPLIPSDLALLAEKKTERWLWILLFTLVFFLCAILRLTGSPQETQLDGIPLMHTADSYAWLAAAKKLNLFSGRLLPEILRSIHLMTGIDIGMIGYYLPLFLAPLVIVPVFILAVWWRTPEAAMPAGLMAGASFGFLSRTLTGWLDTDVLTLFFPVSLAVALLVWLEKCIANPRTVDDGRRWTYGGAFVIGLLFRCSQLFYPNGEVILLSIVICALLVGLARAHDTHWSDLSICIVIVLLAGNGSWIGIGCVAGITGLALVRPEFLSDRKVRVTGVFLAVSLLLLCYSFENFSTIWLKISRYGKFAPATDQLNLPSVITTVEEAQVTGLQVAIRSIAGNWLLFAAGIIGFAYCALKRPAVLVFSPLLVLGLLSWKLGARFGMYGGAALGVGLGFGLAFILRSYGVKPPVRWICQTVTAGVILWTAKSLLLTTNLTDWHMSRDYAQTFKELKLLSAADAQLWTWWDWGYAAQYFSERTTFADGGRNAATYVVPLARVHYTSSPLYAYQLMRFTAEQQKSRGGEMKATERAPQYVNPFHKLISMHEPKQAQDLMEGFGSKMQLSGRDLPEQYLILTWDNLKYVPVIETFGSWNLLTGTSAKGAFPDGGDLKVDIRNGLISYRGKRFELAAMDMVSRQNGRLDRQHQSWQGRKEEFFSVANSMDGSFYPLEDASYNSLMIQMLIGEPVGFEPYFQLVIDRAPSIRVYRLNQNLS